MSGGTLGLDFPLFGPTTRVVDVPLFAATAGANPEQATLRTMLVACNLSPHRVNDPKHEFRVVITRMDVGYDRED